ncbi:MAG: rRNA adenine dimethyltransferase family protein [bacterium]
MLKPLRSLGQNFLVDKNIINKVVEAGEIKSDDVVLEIGPGRGALTFELAKRAGKVIAIEKDKGLARELEEEVKSREIKNVEIIHGDALKLLNPPTPFKKGEIKEEFLNPLTPFPKGMFLISPLLEEEGKGDFRKTPDLICKRNILNFPPLKRGVRGDFKVISNPPYDIASRLLVDLLVSSENSPEKIVFVIQKEVGEKVLLKQGEMNLFSVLLQAFGEPKIISNISRRSFSPQPRVDSVILSIDKKVVDFDKTDFLKIVKLGFSSKRKKLINNLSKEFSKEIVEEFFEEIGLNKGIRPQDLATTQWILLTKKIDMLK